MKSLNQLARKAYAAYCQRAGEAAMGGRPVPDWLHLSAEQQACWIEAARAVHEEVKHIH